MKTISMKLAAGLAALVLPQGLIAAEARGSLRQRVDAAGKRGIYVAIMLFEGICFRSAATVWAGHPVHPTNNTNGINGGLDGDGKALEVQSFAIPAIVEIHREYVRRVLDTVNDLANVLYDISKESRFTPVIVDWQEKMIGFIDEHQVRRPKRHPVGMTPQGFLASSGYCLAHPGREYFVYLPAGGEVDVDLTAASGSIQVEWFNPRSGMASRGDAASGAERRSFKAPFEGDAVLYLKAGSPSKP